MDINCNNKKREDIKFAAQIILYLLLAIAFFSFGELEEVGVKHLVIELFLISIFSLTVLFITFTIIKRKNIRKGFFKSILTLACVPFVIFFIFIFTRALFFYMFGKGMGEGTNFLYNFTKIIEVLISSESVLSTILLTLIIVLFILIRNVKKKNRSL